MDRNIALPKTRSRLLATSLLVGAAAIGAPALTAAIVGLTPGVAAAQDYTTGTLNGHVESDDGKPVAGATVTVRSAQGQTRTATTDGSGNFVVPALASGGYVVDISASGLTALTGQHVTVAPGTGSAFTFTLSTPGAVAEVVVTGTRRTQDFTQTSTGLAVDVQDLSTHVPVGRSITNIVQLSPSSAPTDPSLVANGVRRNQSVSNLAGASGAETSYYINGLNVTDQRTGLGFAQVPFDAIQSINVQTGGYAAEFGRATGGTVNIVTRSGSNDFHAGFSLYYTPDELRSTSPTAYGPGGSAVAGTITYNKYLQSSTLDSDVWVSGPVLKDHIFFFGLINPRETHGWSAFASNGPTGLNATTGTIQYNKSDTPAWFTKTDFNITDTQRIEATVWSDAAKTFYQTYTANITNGPLQKTAVAPALVSKSGGLDQIYRYTGVWTDWFTLSALYGRVESQYTDEGPLATVPRIRDLTGVASPANPTGGTYFFTTANSAGLFNTADKDTRDTYRIDADFYFHLFGSHHVKVGYDLEKLTTTDEGGYNGGYIEDVRQSATLGLYALQTVYLTGGAFTADQGAYYLQDEWKVLPNFTLQLGVRNDTYNYKNSAGQSFVDRNNQWAPRVGFTWDPFNSGNDKVFGSYGRYYLPLAENLAIRGSGANPYYQAFYRVTRDASGNIVVDANGLPVLGAEIQPRSVFQSSNVPDPRAVVARNASPMFSEEFIIGWDHTFRDTKVFNGAFDGFRAGIHYIDRKLGTTLEDTNLQITSPDDDVSGNPYGTGAIGNYCKRTGISAANCTGSSTYEGIFTVVNPGSPAEVYVDVDGTGKKWITLSPQDLNLPKADSHYRALEFTFERPFDGKWGLQGSYTYAIAKGNYSGAVNSDIGQTDTSATQDFDQPWNEIGAYGNLPTVPRHSIKIFGSYSPFENASIGANLLAQSGLYYSCLGYAPDAIAIGADGGTPSTFFCPQGPNNSRIEVPRGTAGVTPWYYQLDLMFSYKVPTPSEFGGVTLEADVFNVFNSHGATRVVEQGEETNGTGVPTAFFGRNRNYQAPRSVRFGIRYAF